MKSNPTARSPSAAESLLAVVEPRLSRRPALGKSPCPYTTNARYCRAILWSPPTTSARCYRASRTQWRERAKRFIAAWPRARPATTRLPSAYHPRCLVLIRPRFSSVPLPAHLRRSQARQRIDSHWRGIVASLLDALMRTISVHRTIITDVCRPTSITVGVKKFENLLLILYFWKLEVWKLIIHSKSNSMID